MDLIRCIAVGYAIVLLLAAAVQLRPRPHRRPGTHLRHLRSHDLQRPAASGFRRLGCRLRLLVAGCFRQFPQAVRHALLPRRAAGAGDGLGLSRSRHPPLWRAEPAARLQDPREPAASGTRRLCDVCGLRCSPSDLGLPHEPGAAPAAAQAALSAARPRSAGRAGRGADPLRRDLVPGPARSRDRCHSAPCWSLRIGARRSTAI